MPIDTKSDNWAFSRGKSHIVASLVVAFTLFLSACTTSDIDTALTPAPLPPAPEPAVVSSVDPFVETQVARDPASLDQSGFPNINAVPVGATTQLSASDKARLQAESRASLNRVSTITPAETAAYQERLRKLKLLGQQHAKNTQRQIEGN